SDMASDPYALLDAVLRGPIATQDPPNALRVAQLVSDHPTKCLADRPPFLAEAMVDGRNPAEVGRPREPCEEANRLRAALRQEDPPVAARIGGRGRRQNAGAWAGVVRLAPLRVRRDS